MKFEILKEIVKEIREEIKEIELPDAPYYYRKGTSFYRILPSFDMSSNLINYRVTIADKEGYDYFIRHKVIHVNQIKLAQFGNKQNEIPYTIINDLNSEDSTIDKISKEAFDDHVIEVTNKFIKTNKFNFVDLTNVEEQLKFIVDAFCEVNNDYFKDRRILNTVDFFEKYVFKICKTLFVKFESEKETYTNDYFFKHENRTFRIEGAANNIYFYPETLIEIID